MSDYDMTFDKKIVDDASFDTIFGGEEDDHLLDLVMKEDADTFNIDERDPEAIEDDLGPVGAGDGLGSDVGPDHDSENKPTDDTADQEALAKDDNELKADGQLNVSDTTGEKVEDGNTVDPEDVHAAGSDELVGNDAAPCPEHITATAGDIADSVDSFDEAAKNLLEDVDVAVEIPEEEVPATVEVTPDAPVAAPVDPVVPTPAEPVTPDAEVPAPVAPATDVGADLDLLDTDPVDDGPVDEKCGESKCEAADTVDPKEVNDDVDFGGVEDKTGKIGEGDGLGNDVGPDHDTANAPKEDTSDEEVVAKDDNELAKDDQLNVSDTTGEKVEDAGMVKDTQNEGEDQKSASDSFTEASVEDLEKMPEEEEDEMIDAVEDNDAKSEFTPSELNADDDDEILSMLD